MSKQKDPAQVILAILRRETKRLQGFNGPDDFLKKSREVWDCLGKISVIVEALSKMELTAKIKKSLFDLTYELDGAQTNEVKGLINRIKGFVVPID